MKRLRTTDAAAGFGMVVLSLVVAASALRFPAAAAGIPGPEVFPLLLSGVGVLLGLGLIGVAVRGRHAPQQPGEDGDGESRRVNRSLAVMGVTILYSVAMPWVGFILGSALLVSVVMLVMGYPHRARAAAIASCVAWMVYLVFAGIMNVPLPAGWIG